MNEIGFGKERRLPHGRRWVIWYPKLVYVCVRSGFRFAGIVLYYYHVLPGSAFAFLIYTLCLLQAVSAAAATVVASGWNKNVRVCSAVVKSIRSGPVSVAYWDSILFTPRSYLTYVISGNKNWINHLFFCKWRWFHSDLEEFLFEMQKNCRHSRFLLLLCIHTCVTSATQYS